VLDGEAGFTDALAEPDAQVLPFNAGEVCPLQREKEMEPRQSQFRA
jgi:hypothetical protein